MIIVMKKDVTQKEIDYVVKRIEKLGLKAMISKGVERTIIGVIGPEDRISMQPLEAFPGVEKVMPILAPYKLVSKEFKPEKTVIDLGKGVKIGAQEIIIMAGPCAIESYDQLFKTAKAVKEAGAQVLRGGAYKPRTSPYSFQGLGEEGLKILKEVAEQLNMPTVTEVMDTRDVEKVLKYTDILQIGARNMQNFSLLKEVGQTQKPVLLKRGMSATIKEWLMAAEYIAVGGNMNIILCERGIRTFEDFTRNTLDLSAVAAVRLLSHLPVIVDPSHGTGKYDLVPDMSLAAVACGADGLIIEVHPAPHEALSDGPQSLVPEKFKELTKKIKRVAEAVGRKF